MPALLFDWDGTILDSWEALIGSYQRATQEVLGREFPKTAEEFAKAITLSGKQIFQDLADSDITAKKLAQVYQEHYFTVPTEPYPGIMNLLNDLKAADVALGVVTSKSRRRMDHDLQRMPELNLFDVIICADDVQRIKPDPEPVLRALNHLSGSTTPAAMVGDTVVDVKAALAGGIPVIGAGWGFGINSDLVAMGAEVADTPADVVALLPGLRETWGLYHAN